MKKKKYKWQTQIVADDCKVIDCPPYDPIADFQRDPSGGYVLIRLDREKCTIELAICNKDHVVTHIFKGKKPQDIYHTIFQLEKRESIEFFVNKQHTAYLGKELNRAYHALLSGDEYIQE